MGMSEVILFTTDELRPEYNIDEKNDTPLSQRKLQRRDPPE
jgi:hypothetical protein